jgi:Na+-translocating ferredoxin:NAD+ oxidoreductase RNF subunit RnfB
MQKTEVSDIHNCSACGYRSCGQMAVAIINGLNKRENCQYYVETIHTTIPAVQMAFANRTAQAGLYPSI